MIIPLSGVAFAFSIVTAFCLFDMLKAKASSIKLFRLFEGVIVGFAAAYYWEAAYRNDIPSPNLRVVWIALCVILCAEVISRQSWGTRKL